MNFLGHLYFSDNDFDLMIANLYGDSIKGKKYLKYPKKIQDGILLHRKIDSYIDNHPAVKELRRKLYPELPKIAGVAIDLYFDHLLAIHWNKYHQKPFDLFLEEFYSFRSPLEPILEKDFLIFLKRLREHKWISYYPSQYGLEKVCIGVSRRISFDNKLSQAPMVFAKRKKEIQKVFFQFMKDAEIDLSNEVHMT